MNFIQNFMMKKLQMKIINMQSKFGILSVVKLFKTITIFILQLMFFFLQTFLRISEKLVSNITNLIHATIIQLLVLRGMRVSKKQNKNFNLLKDYDMLMMFEQGIRGGISHISKRYAEANNKYMKDFDESKPSTFIQYLDANNLYGWAMTQKLPTHGFKWIDVDKSSVLRLLEKKDTNQGFIFEVDLDYPRSLWKSHNDYPLAPERIKIDKIDKLICSFLPKKHYVLHYKNLKQYLQEGMILKKVHRGLKFVQSPWMKPYIIKNTDLRKEAKNAFEKDFFKLMNNSVFGKTIENIRKRQSVEIMDDRKKLSNYHQNQILIV